MATDTTTDTAADQIPSAADVSVTNPPAGETAPPKRKRPPLETMLANVVSAVRTAEDGNLNNRLVAGYWASEYTAAWCAVHGLSGRKGALDGIAHDISKETGLIIDGNELVRIYQTYAILSGASKAKECAAAAKTCPLPYASVKLFAPFVERVSAADGKSETWRLIATTANAVSGIWSVAVSPTEEERETGVKCGQWAALKDKTDLLLADVLDAKAESEAGEERAFIAKAKKAAGKADKDRYTAAAAAAAARAEKTSDKADALRDAVALRQMTPEERKKEKERKEAQAGGGKPEPADTTTPDVFRSLVVDSAKNAEAEELAQTVALVFAHAGDKGPEILKRVLALMDWKTARLTPALASGVQALPKTVRASLFALLARTLKADGWTGPTDRDESAAPVAAPVNRLPAEAPAA